MGTYVYFLSQKNHLWRLLFT